MTTRVTIGVCIKNSEKIMRKALDSIVEQDFPHEQMELIIVDDGSTDNTLAIAKDFIPVIDIESSLYHTKGEGLAFSRQLVVNNAEGEYVVWVDGDQELPKDFVREHVKFMENNPSVAAASGNEILRGKSLAAFLESMSIVYKNRISHSLVDVGGGIFRLEAIRKVGGFDTTLKGAGEDVEITNRMKRAGMKIARDDADFYHNHRTTWRALWSEYFWWGYGMHYVNHKQKFHGFPSSRFPIFAFFIGIKMSIPMYKVFGLKRTFLLPLQYLFKNTAFCLGYIKSHMNHHGHFIIEM